LCDPVPGRSAPPSPPQNLKQNLVASSADLLVTKSQLDQVTRERDRALAQVAELQAAVAGANPDVTGDKLHRIDPAQVRAGLTKAGFKIEEESSLLANPADARTVAAIDPSMHFKTDQFLFRAVKPK
jgi:hypothetical protein